VTEKTGWASAEKHCNSMQARLAIIANDAEQRALAGYLSTLNSQY